MKNLEARVERLEQRALMHVQNEPLEVVVTGAWRDADGVLHDDETHPPIIIKIPGNFAVDNPPFFAGG